MIESSILNAKIYKIYKSIAVAMAMHAQVLMLSYDQSLKCIISKSKCLIVLKRTIAYTNSVHYTITGFNLFKRGMDGITSKQSLRMYR